MVQLFDEGNTVPFITRYRKERTGGLDEEVIRQIQKRVNFMRQLADRRHMILKSLETHGWLNEDLHKAILSADTMKRLEDLYLPYKPKKKSLAYTGTGTGSGTVGPGCVEPRRRRRTVRGVAAVLRQS